MSFQIHSQGAYQLTDVRVAQAVFLPCISMNARLSVLCLDLILPLLVSQKDCSEEGNWGTLRNHKGCSDCYSTANPGVDHRLYSAWDFPRSQKQPPRYLPSSSKHASTFAVILFFVGVPPWRYRCPKYRLKNNRENNITFDNIETTLCSNQRGWGNRVAGSARFVNDQSFLLESEY